MKSKMLITSPIFYPNAKPHIGTSHTLIICDFLSRSFKIFDYEVFFSTGTDENCEKVDKTAKNLNISTQVYVDNIAHEFKECMKFLKINYDRFIRTTDNDHKEAVKKFWLYIENKGLIYKGKYSGYYSVSDETFFPEKSLIDGKAPTGAEVRWEEADAYFFKSSAFRQTLIEFLENNNNFTFPKNRKNELLGFISESLDDLCISRKLGWGIPTPNDPNFTIYVWFDALVNYLTIYGYPDYNKWNNSRVIHVVGKDIAVFHGVHWPTMLLAHDIKVCDNLLVHNWWLTNSEKMSKSKNNVIDPMTMIEQYGTAPLRFYCLKENLIKGDGNFEITKMIEYYNTYLVGKFSNLVHRLWTITSKANYFEKHMVSNENYELKLKESLEGLDISSYINILFEWCDELNQKIDHGQAWKNIDLAKDLFHETISLIKYFDAIEPGILEIFNNNKNPVILCNRISL